LSKIVSISTALPAYKHEQNDILAFMQNVYALDETEKRKLRFLYRQSSIQTRYSVLPDYSLEANEWEFYPASENIEPFPGLEVRMKWYSRHAAPLSVESINKCLNNSIEKDEVTHLITVSCTGMSAPGLDLQIMELLQLPASIFRTSINFMGCYAAIHAMKLADAFCKTDANARVLIVCTELCTLHFQKEPTPDNIASSLLFGDGSAAMLVVPDEVKLQGLRITDFYSEVGFNGKNHMSWELSSTGFLMTLSSYIPELIEQDFNRLLQKALQHAHLTESDISHWCIHPGGKRILAAVEHATSLNSNDLAPSYQVLHEYGNMSSPTVLFVLKAIAEQMQNSPGNGSRVFGAAFGPGLTMETFILSHD
jgi:alkylresorcinol/alkylpyrone synthase